MQRLGFAAVGVVAVLTYSFAQEPADLKWRFKIGDSQKYTFKHKEVRTVEVGDLRAETTTVADFDWLWTVEDIDTAGVVKLNAKLENLRFSTAGQGFDIGYDSARGNRGDADYDKRFIGLMDQFRYAGKYHLRLDARGKLHEVKGLSKILQENDPGLNILDYHCLNLRDETFAFFLQTVLGRLPDDAKKSKWQLTGDQSLGELGNVTGPVHFTRDAKADAEGLLPIRWQGTQTAELNSKWINVDFKGALKTTKLEGTMRFDPRSGWMHSGNAAMHFGGELKIGGGMFKMSYQHELELTKQ